MRNIEISRVNFMFLKKKIENHRLYWFCYMNITNHQSSDIKDHI